MSQAVPPQGTRLDPLADALEAADLSRFETLLAQSEIASLERENFDNGDTLIFFAICEGADNFVAAMLRAGFDPNYQDPQGTTPIAFACTQDPVPAIVRMLVVAGANPNLGDAGDGYAPLTVAAGRGRHETAAALLAGGADPNETNNGSMTALIQACTERDAAMVQRLLSAGAVPCVGADGMTPHEAAGGHAAILAMLEA